MDTKRKPVHPGNILQEDVLAPPGLTVSETASDLEISKKTLSELINGNLSVLIWQYV